MKLGKKILGLRKEKGLSQEDLGKKINVTRQTISNWELGGTFPNPEQLKLLSKEFQISIDDLLDNDYKKDDIEKNERPINILLKVMSFILMIFISFVFLYLILFLIYKVNVKNENNSRILESVINCKLYDENHDLLVKYDEKTGKVISKEGDTYFYDMLGLVNYSDKNQIFNIINDYVNRNGGTCNILNNN